MAGYLRDQIKVHSEGAVLLDLRWFVFHKLGSTNSYKLVAVVQVTSPEEVFRLTNHPPAQSQRSGRSEEAKAVNESESESENEKGWQTNAGVIRVMPGPQRSTSVGDMVIQERGERTWLVESQGFRLLREGRRSRGRARGQADGRPKLK